MLSGLFGISALIVSLSANTEIPKQSITESIHVSFSGKVKAIGAAVFSGSLTGIMPGKGYLVHFSARKLVRLKFSGFSPFDIF